MSVLKNKILEALEKELDTARNKENESELEYNRTKKTISLGHWDTSIGYTNGIMEAIDIVKRIKE